MPTTTADNARNERAVARPLTKMGVAAPLLGWLIPGAGHFLLRRWWRGALLMSSVTVMFVLGLLMQGKVYQANAGDILDMLGFIGDLGAGGLYMLTRIMNW